MKFAVLLLACASAAVAQPEDSAWVSYYNGVDGWFEFQGPERAMLIEPGDFGLECPLQVESLKIWYYGGMGSFEDSVLTFKLYAGDGSTALFESDSITCPRSYWVYYGLDEPVVIDSGSFYIAVTARTVNPYAHPYINIDDSDPTHSYYGSAGAWTACTFGELCFHAFVRELATGVEEGRWAEPAPGLPAPTIVRGMLDLPGRKPAALLDLHGRRVGTLLPGQNDVSHLSAGVYFACPTQAGTARRVVIGR
jgi:hypothetical protein